MHIYTYIRKSEYGCEYMVPFIRYVRTKALILLSIWFELNQEVNSGVSRMSQSGNQSYADFILIGHTYSATFAS